METTGWYLSIGMCFVLVYCCVGMLMTSCFGGTKPILGCKRITLPEPYALWHCFKWVSLLSYYPEVTTVWNWIWLVFGLVLCTWNVLLLTLIFSRRGKFMFFKFLSLRENYPHVKIKPICLYERNKSSIMKITPTWNTMYLANIFAKFSPNENNLGYSILLL